MDSCKQPFNIDCAFFLPRLVKICFLHMKLLLWFWVKTDQKKSDELLAGVAISLGFLMLFLWLK